MSKRVFSQIYGSLSFCGLPFLSSGVDCFNGVLSLVRLSNLKSTFGCGDGAITVSERLCLILGTDKNCSLPLSEIDVLFFSDFRFIEFIDFKLDPSEDMFDANNKERSAIDLEDTLLVNEDNFPSFSSSSDNSIFSFIVCIFIQGAVIFGLVFSTLLGLCGIVAFCSLLLI